MLTVIFQNINKPQLTLTCSITGGLCDTVMWAGTLSHDTFSPESTLALSLTHIIVRVGHPVSLWVVMSSPLCFNVSFSLERLRLKHVCMKHNGTLPCSLFFFIWPTLCKSVLWWSGTKEICCLSHQCCQLLFFLIYIYIVLASGGDCLSIIHQLWLF